MCNDMLVAKGEPPPIFPPALGSALPAAIVSILAQEAMPGAPLRVANLRFARYTNGNP